MKIANSIAAFAMGRGGCRGGGRGRMTRMHQSQGGGFRLRGRGMGRCFGGLVPSKPASGKERKTGNEPARLNLPVDNQSPRNQHFQKQVSEFAMKQRLVANVDQELCTACGACAEACLCNAIHIENGYAQVNEEDCIGCGVCVNECPVDAIRMP